MGAPCVLASLGARDPEARRHYLTGHSLVRRARPEDAAEIAAVHVRTWQAAYEHVFGAERLAGLDPERRRLGWERALSERFEEEDVFVAEQDGRVVAFASAGAAGDEPGEGEALRHLRPPGSLGRRRRSRADAGGARGAARPRLSRGDPLGAQDNPRARRVYEREGWRLDDGESARKVKPHLGVDVAEVRYRISL